MALVAGRLFALTVAVDAGLPFLTILLFDLLASVFLLLVAKADFAGDLVLATLAAWRELSLTDTTRAPFLLLVATNELATAVGVRRTIIGSSFIGGGDAKPYRAKP